MKTILETYKNKKVFVTGHTGFKGSWLTMWLKELGADVCGYSLEPDTDPALFNQLGLAKDIKHIIADVRDLERLTKEIKAFSPDIVLHLAAQPLVKLSYKEPVLTYQTNVMGTVNLLEACRQHGGIKSIVNVTTDKCYENKETDYAYKETDPFGGYDPYSNSKGCSELVTACYRNSYFNPQDYGAKHNTALASARAGNVIGGGDYSADRLLPDFIKAIRANQDIFIRSPKATRPWQFVLEPLSGYLVLGARLFNGDINLASGWNFGPYDSSILTVEEVVKEAIKDYGQGSYSIDKNAHPHEATLLKLDITKAETQLDWHPVYTAQQAIAATIEWYKGWYEGKDVLALTHKQLKEYSDKL
ncbi:CDP-glucose 4 [Elusimicrobium simillimum]|uniref:CDP-glucose 4,6-dehydratase n=1 Tax=Elusimicrobium simillimum TaxID=3143438 RepID=UPI003C6F783C